MLAAIYNTLWRSTSQRGGSTAKHYRILWLTTLIRQYAMLQSDVEREAFIRQLRLNNFGPQSEKRYALRPPRGSPKGPPDAGPGPGPSAGPRIVATASRATKRK